MNTRLSLRFKNLPVVSEHEVGRPRFKFRNPGIPGMLEIVTQGVYDYYEVAAATVVTEQLLFSIAVGGSYTPAGGIAFQKKRFHTNLVQQGQLEAPNKLLMKGLSIFIRNDISPTDLNLFLGNTQMTFRVNQKTYLEHLCGRFPAGGGSFGSFVSDVAAVTFGTVGNGYPQASAIYTLEGQGIQIEQQQNFTIDVDPTQVQAGAFTTAAAGGTTFGTGIKATFSLEGLLSRLVL